MAYHIALADGNLTDAATWGVVDATALLDAENTNTALTTSYVESAAFTPGAITIDGIAVKIATRAVTPAANTISVRLAQAAATVAGTEVTINVSDLSSRNGEQGWYFFKFAAPVLLVAATAYTVSAKTSAASMVNLFRNATAGNWSRMLRTTTTGAPGAGDDCHVLGEWTAAATVTARVVTMNSTAATDYGSGSTTIPSWTVGASGTLQFGTTAATTYILRLSAILAIFHGGTLTMGTPAVKMPRDSSARIEFDSAADGGFGLRVYGTAQAQGQSRTSGKDIVQALLNTDEAAAQTVLGVDTDTGWLSGDEIAIASTTQTPGQAETRVLASDAAATTVTVTVGLTNAHSGTTPTQAEVVLLTRNVRLESVSATLMAFVYFGPAAVIDFDWVAFRYLGHTSTAGRQGVEIDVTAAGSMALSYCAIRDFDNHGLYVNAAAADNLTIEHLTGWGVGNRAAGQAAVRISDTSGANWSVTNSTIVSGVIANQGYCFQFLSISGTATNLRGNSGGGHGIHIVPGSVNFRAMTKAWSGFHVHSNQNAGINFDGGILMKLSDVHCWRCNVGTVSAGLFFNSPGATIIINGGNVFGCSTHNLRMGSSGSPLPTIVLRNLAINGDTTFATTNGFIFPPANNSSARVTFDNCNFGTVAGIKTAHTNDININNPSGGRWAEITLRNTILASATEILNQAFLIGTSVIRYQRADGVTNVHKTVYPTLGTKSYETVTVHTAPVSEKLEPTAASAVFKLDSGVKRVNVNAAGTIAVSVWVRKNGAYAGAAPRLILKSNPSLGVTADTVLASFSAAADTWQQLAGTTPAAAENGVFEFVVDCDGAAGAVFVADWAGS